MNVGFYYMANAGGRLAGTMLSGLLYQWQGLEACLWASSIFVLAAGLISLSLPTHTPIKTPPIRHAGSPRLQSEVVASNRSAKQAASRSLLFSGSLRHSESVQGHASLSAESVEGARSGAGVGRNRVGRTGLECQARRQGPLARQSVRRSEKRIGSGIRLSRRPRVGRG